MAFCCLLFFNLSFKFKSVGVLFFLLITAFSWINLVRELTVFNFFLMTIYVIKRACRTSYADLEIVHPGEKEG